MELKEVVCDLMQMSWPQNLSPAHRAISSDASTKS